MTSSAVIVESFFSSLKVERVARKTYRKRDQARADVFDYMYNPKRTHSTIGYMSPMEFEQRRDQLRLVSTEPPAAA